MVLVAAVGHERPVAVLKKKIELFRGQEVCDQEGKDAMFFSSRAINCTSCAWLLVLCQVAAEARADENRYRGYSSSAARPVVVPAQFTEPIESPTPTPATTPAVAPNAPTPAQYSSPTPAARPAPSQASDYKPPMPYVGATPQGKASYQPTMPEPPNIGAMIFRLCFGTLVALGLCAGTLFYGRRWLQGAVPGLPGPNSKLRVLEMTPLGSRCAVFLLQAGDQQVLVGTDSQGMKSLVVLPQSFDRTLAEQLRPQEKNETLERKPATSALPRKLISALEDTSAESSLTAGS